MSRRLWHALPRRRGQSQRPMPVEAAAAAGSSRLKRGPATGQAAVAAQDQRRCEQRPGVLHPQGLQALLQQRQMDLQQSWIRPPSLG